MSISKINDNKMSNIKERIIQVIEFKKLRKEEFFKKLNVSSSNFRKSARNTPLNSDTIDKILSVIEDLNADWLITGKGPMLRDESRPKIDTQSKDELEELRKRIKEQAQLIDFLNEKLESYKKLDIYRTTHARS